MIYGMWAEQGNHSNGLNKYKLLYHWKHFIFTHAQFAPVIINFTTIELQIRKIWAAWL